MCRRLSTLFCALSLLLFVAVCVLWVRSYGIADSFHWTQSSWQFYVLSADGEFRLEHIRNGVEMNTDGGFRHWTDRVDGSGAFPDRVPGARLHFRLAGFALVTGERWGDEHFAAFAPGWFLFVMTLLYPSAVAARRFRAGRLQQDGLCPTCGYDLRATPERCPECGMNVPPKRRQQL